TVGSSPTDPSARAMMIEARQELTDTAAEAIVVYSDLGLDDGMRSQIADAVLSDKPVEYRTLPGWSCVQAKRHDSLRLHRATFVQIWKDGQYASDRPRDTSCRNGHPGHPRSHPARSLL